MSALALLASLPLSEILDLVDVLLDDGTDPDEAIESVVSLLDRLLTFGLWVPGPAGEAIESIDGPVLRAALGLILAFAADPDRRAARKARRAARRKRRAEKRAARKQS